MFIKPRHLPHHAVGTQRGASLIIVMLILIVVSILGVGGAQIALMAERGARNDRDMQVAWQAAEAALVDAELDLTSAAPNASSPARGALFGMTRVGTPARNVQADKVDVNNFVADCGSASAVGTGGLSTFGLCSLPVTGKPAWLTVNFETTGSGAQTVPFGQFTGRSFASGSTGAQPARAPRYIIEAIRDEGASSRDKASSDIKYVYRVTAMGFGPRDDIQAVMQMIYRN